MKFKLKILTLIVNIVIIQIAHFVPMTVIGCLTRGKLCFEYNANGCAYIDFGSFYVNLTIVIFFHNSFGE